MRVVLSHPSHPGNIGAAARAMKTMGLSQLVLVRPKSFPAAEAEARASGATDVLAAARVVDTLQDALAGTVRVVALTSRRRELMAPVQWAREAAPALAAAAAQGDVALVFGNETFGLSNDELALCHTPVMIPANPDYASLNLAAAVQLLCYELRLAVLAPEPPPQTVLEAAAHEDIERLMQHFERAMTASGFLDPARPRRLMPRLRRLFARAGLEQEEVNILRGMLSALERGKVD